MRTRGPRSGGAHGVDGRSTVHRGLLLRIATALPRHPQRQVGVGRTERAADFFRQCFRPGAPQVLCSPCPTQHAITRPAGIRGAPTRGCVPEQRALPGTRALTIAVPQALT